jgi:hypothetical protein
MSTTGSDAVSSTRQDEIERLLDERGWNLGAGRARIALGRSGIAVGFPRDPMIHVSWWILAGVVALLLLRSSRRRGE